MRRSRPPLPSRTVISRRLEIHVLDPQTQSFEQPHPGGVEQARGEPARTVELRQQGPHFALGKHHWHACRALGPHHPVHPRQLFCENFAIEEQQRSQRLILRRGRDPPLGCEVRQERFDLGPAHLPRVAFAVEVDEAARPVQVGVFRAQAVVLHPQAISVLVEQLRRRHNSHDTVYPYTMKYQADRIEEAAGWE